MTFRRFIFLGISVLALSLNLVATGAEAKSEGYLKWEDYVKKLKKDPALVRLYLFEEKHGTVVSNSAPETCKNGYGTMDMISESPYGQSREKFWFEWAPFSKKNQIFPEWTEGRWPGKGALASGMLDRNMVRSRFSGTKSGIFTIAAWVRMQGRSAKGELFRVHTGRHPVTHKLSKNSGFFVLYSNKKIKLKMGIPSGSADVDSAAIEPQMWHYIVGMWDGKKLKIYIDGKLSGEKECKGPYKHPVRCRPDAVRMPEYDLFGFDIGGKRGGERFDIDEIAIFERALTEDEIVDNYRTGKPQEPLAEQLARSKRQLEARKKIESIKMDIPKDSYGIFRQNEVIPLSIKVPADSVPKGNYTATFIITDIQNHAVVNKDIKLEVKDKAAVAKTEFSTDKCGLYFINMKLSDASGKLVKQIPEEYGIAITVPLPAPKDIPYSAPLMSHNHTAYPERRLLGFRVDRVIKGAHIWKSKDDFRKDYFKDEFDNKRKYGMNLFYCLHLGIPWAEKAPGKKYLLKDMNIWAEYCKKMYKNYGDFVYAWEIENEPNAGHAAVPPAEYVEFLKVSYKAFKEVDPDCIVVGGAGCPGFLNYYEKVYKAGGAKYFDVLSLHNYGFDPIKSFKEKRLIKRAIEQLKKYRGEVVPVWNSESGFQNIARGPDNRPMTEDVMMRDFPRTIKSKSGPAVLKLYMPTTIESVRRNYQIQAILLDLAAGCEKYTLLASTHSYLPIYKGSKWQPSELTPALAALNSILIPSKSVKEIVLSADTDAGALITGKDNKHTAVFFSDETPTLSFKVDRSGTFKGMDINGNPLTFEAGDDKILTVKVGAAATYIFDVPETISQVSFMEILNTPTDLPENGKITGTLKVMNPLKEKLSAEIIQVPPQDATIELSATRVDLEPGKSIEIPFVLDGKKLKRRRYSLGFKLKTANSQLGKLSYYFDSEGVMQMVKETKTNNPNWWKNIEPEVADQEINVAKGKPVPGVPWAPQWRGKEDLSFTSRLSWTDNKEILIRIDVVDNVLFPAPKDEKKRIFFYDCVEVFFDGRSLAKRSDLMTNGLTQILIVPNITDEVKDCYFWIAGKNLKKTMTAKVKGAKNPNGYWVEIRLKPKEDFSFKVRSGSQFAYDVLIDDTDEEISKRKVGMTMHGEFNNARDPSKWGRYQLVDGE